MKSIIDRAMEEWSGYYSGVSSDEIASILGEAHKSLIKVRDSGIGLKNYHDNAEKLKRDAEYLQRWSSKKIGLDKIPTSTNTAYYLMHNYLTINGVKDTFAIFGMYNMLYKDVFGKELERRPRKKEKGFMEVVESFEKIAKRVEDLPDFLKTEKGKDAQEQVHQHLKKQAYDRAVKEVLELPEVKKLINERLSPEN